MGTGVRSHYDNLQVKENASDEVIKGAYRYLSQRWHPDRNPDNREEAERVLKIINQAYAVLSNPDRRREHDAWIARQSRGADQVHHTSGRAPGAGNGGAQPERPASNPRGEPPGNSSTGSAHGQGPPFRATVPNHLVWAILTTIFCCLPLGIVSIVKSVEVNSKLAAGDIAGARAASSMAKTLAISAAIVGAALIFFVFLDVVTQAL